MSLKKHKVNGIKIWLDVSDNGISRRLIATKGKREPAFDWIMKREARGIAFDVGANIGYCSLLMRRRCDEVYSFEPDKRNLRILWKNANHNKKIHVIPFAVSDRKGHIKFTLARKPNLNVTGKGRHKVECIDLDTFSVKPDFIKCDIEGGETQLLTGAMETLEQNNIGILIEVHPERYTKKNNFRKVLEMLLRKGYKFKYVINAKGKVKLLKPYRCVKKFGSFPRRIWKDVPDDKCLKWATTLPKDGKKVLRAIYLRK